MYIYIVYTIKDGSKNTIIPVENAPTKPTTCVNRGKQSAITERERDRESKSKRETKERERE